MGFFVYFCNRFRCLRCGMESLGHIQSKLLRTESDNSCREYHVGDSEIVDGIDDYCPLYPWNGSEPLVAAVGDWSCQHCSLNWQWAKLVLKVNDHTRFCDTFSATITELSSLIPGQASELAGIHLVESWLAESSGLWGRGPDYNWAGGLEKWINLPVADRCERVALGYRTWCREIAGLELPSPAR